MLVLLQQGAEVAYSIVVAINDFLHGTLIEGLIIAVALHIYLFHYSSWSRASRGRSKANANIASAAAAAGTRSGRCFLVAAPPARSKWDASCGSEAKQVQRLVGSLLTKRANSSPDALSQYENLVRCRQVDLQRHIQNDSNARSMYIELIRLAVAYASEESPKAPEGTWRWTLRLLQDMRLFGFPRSLEFYAMVIKLHVQARYLHEALLLHCEMLADGILPDQNIYTVLLNVSISTGELDKALSIFESLSKLGPMSVRMYMTVLRVYDSKKDWHGATQLLDRMEAADTPPDSLVLNNVLALCVSTGQVKTAEALLPRWKGVLDTVSCNILLKGFAQEAKLQKAEILLSKMMSEGPAPNLITFNTIMDCAVRALQAACGSTEKPTGGTSLWRGTNLSPAFLALAHRPWELLDKLMDLGLEPDRYTCSTIVKGMHFAGCSTVQLDRAVSLLRRVGPVALQGVQAGGRSTGCGNARLVEVLFNTLLDACVTVRDLDRMGEIFEMMQEFKVGVSAVTFGTLIKAFGQAGRLQRCHEVWEDMRNHCIKPTIVTFGCYMDACIRNEDIAKASALFEMMLERGVRPNAVVYTSLIRGFAQAKLPAKALELYRRMRSEGIEATCVTFNSILDVLARQLSEASALQEVIDDMHEASIQPDIVTYSILLKASCNAGNLRSALSLFRQSRSHGLVFDQVAINTLLQACSKADRIADAEEIFEEMCRMDVMPSHVTTSILVKMYGKAHMLDKAIAVSERMEREYGRKPNLFVYTCLIQACVQNKRVRKSWDIFNRMLRAGVEPDAITYGTVIHGCVYLNRFEHALTLVRHAYMRPPKIDIIDAALEVPFAVDAMPAKHVVPLQPEVLQMLLANLRKKEQRALATELEDIIAENPPVVPEPLVSGKSGASWSSRHRWRTVVE